MSPETAPAHRPDPPPWPGSPRPVRKCGPRRWRAMVLGAALAAAACSGSQPAAELSETERILANLEAYEAQQAAKLAAIGRDPDTATVEPDCHGSEEPEVDEGTVRLCFVAFGDATLDGSGPDKLLEGVRIFILEGRGGDPSSGIRLWADSLKGGWGKSAGHGRQFRSTPESIAAAAAPFAVTGADGTASAVVRRYEEYAFCAVHPDDAGLIAGCSTFDPWISFVLDQPADALGHHAHYETGAV